MKKFLISILLFSQLFSCFASEPKKSSWKPTESNNPQLSASQSVQEVILIKKEKKSETGIFKKVIENPSEVLPFFTGNTVKDGYVIAWPHQVIVGYQGQDAQKKEAIIRCDGLKNIILQENHLMLQEDNGDISFYTVNNPNENIDFEAQNGIIQTVCSDQHDKGVIIVLNPLRNQQSYLQKIAQNSLELGEKTLYESGKIVAIKQVLSDQIVVRQEDGIVKVLNNKFQPLLQFDDLNGMLLSCYFKPRKDFTTQNEKVASNKNLLNKLKDKCYEGQVGALVSALGSGIVVKAMAAIGYEKNDTTRAEDASKEINDTLNVKGIPNNLEDLWVGAFENENYLIAVVRKNSQDKPYLKFIPICKETKELADESIQPLKVYYKTPILFKEDGRAFVEVNKQKAFVGKTMDSQTLAHLYKAGIAQ